MFGFFGHRKDSSKKPVEKESDGFVIIGETVEEQAQKIQKMNIIQPATNVIVEPSKTSSKAPPLPADPAPPQPSEPVPALPELLSDVPFMLAPHIQAIQTGLPCLPDVQLSEDINHGLATFCYDFSLENSVLCDS